MRRKDSKYVCDGEMKCERQSRRGKKSSIALEGVSRGSLAARPLASSSLENDYGLSKTQGPGKGHILQQGLGQLCPSVYSCLA